MLPFSAGLWLHSVLMGEETITDRRQWRWRTSLLRRHSIYLYFLFPSFYLILDALSEAYVWLKLSFKEYYYTVIFIVRNRLPPSLHYPGRFSLTHGMEVEIYTKLTTNKTIDIDNCLVGFFFLYFSLWFYLTVRNFSAHVHGVEITPV